MTHPQPTDVPTLALRPERQLVRRSGSYRHVDFVVAVPPAPPSATRDRSPVHLALVLDRSGSTAGAKIATARLAALATVDRLDERDRCAVVVFDDRVDVLQGAAPVTVEVKRRVRAELARVEARAETALHEAWLTGARAIASDGDAGAETLGRVFLLTDGLANVGETDPERIAAEAQDVRRRAGIGADYNEALLGPLAVAGGGQFHHLRSMEEIARTFVGELGELFAVAARSVALEIDVDPAVTVDVVSAYRASTRPGGLAVGLGDLGAGDERHVVVRFGVPPGRDQTHVAVRARLVWSGAEGPDWQELRFAYADHGDCDAERRDPAAMRHVGRQHADRALREAVEHRRRGDTGGAREAIERVARRIAEYAGDDPELRAILADLRAFTHEIATAPPMALKEAYYGSHTRSRGQRDLRGP